MLSFADRSTATFPSRIALKLYTECLFIIMTLQQTDTPVISKLPNRTPTHHPIKNKDFSINTLATQHLTRPYSYITLILINLTYPQTHPITTSNNPAKGENRNFPTSILDS